MEALEPSEWETVLRLANLWQFQALRKAAIAKLQPVIDGMTAPCAIVMARRYHVDRWLVNAVEIMAKRPEPVSVQDVEIIGLEDALKVAHVREQAMMILKSMSRGTSTWVDWRERSELKFRPTIQQVFGIEQAQK